MLSVSLDLLHKRLYSTTREIELYKNILGLTADCLMYHNEFSNISIFTTRGSTRRNNRKLAIFACDRKLDICLRLSVKRGTVVVFINWASFEFVKFVKGNKIDLGKAFDPNME